jgi:hypothetical protein
MVLDVEDIDWEGIKRELNQVAEPFKDECGNTVKAIFLGSVFSLTPSGKYYTPWACGNVDEEDVKDDQEWWEALEKKAHENGLYITSGEGDPTDIIVGMTVEEEPEGKACLTPQMKPECKKKG